MSVSTENPSIFAPFGPVHMLRLRGALSIEIKTGMSNSKGSTMNYIRSLSYADPTNPDKQIYLTSKRTKRGVLADLENFMINVMKMDIKKTEFPK